MSEIDLSWPERVHAAPTHRVCRACDGTRPLGEMVPVGNAPADLGVMLTGRWLCTDEQACLDRYTARSKGDRVMFAVIIPPAPNAWAGGHVPLYTDNPRHAEQHAAAYHACVVPLRIRTDYRETR